MKRYEDRFKANRFSAHFVENHTTLGKQSLAKSQSPLLTI